ncbi:anti-sigma factor family protein [Pseudonocardia acidicola]|uniref:Putative zinc-finger domain-containing protein n=1 Tax=Pseudonocardia acidicola TaxID=2724939 RepID=A0ABX1SJI4_9PSEU|nr:zf-HC2 domain-containing protein [Pseudonocardia acidicola]NMI00678.1 hypothetical protein [Pseudonocardia acidicola]
MTDARRRFSVSAPDWGEAHLTLDAIVAFVDDELTAGAHARASQHVAHCPECAAEVIAQGQVRAALRSAAGPSMPSSLLSSLRAIPQDTDLPGPPPGLAMTAEGRFVSVLRPTPAAVPPHPPAAVPPHPPERPAPGAGVPRSVPDRRSTMHRRMRLGAGAAVSGLALGALALAAPSASIDAPTAVPAADRGVLGGSLLGNGAQAGAVLDARMSPASGATATPAAAETPSPTVTQTDLTHRLDTMPPSFPVAGQH